MSVLTTTTTSSIQDYTVREQRGLSKDPELSRVHKKTQLLAAFRYVVYAAFENSRDANTLICISM